MKIKGGSLGIIVTNGQIDVIITMFENKKEEIHHDDKFVLNFLKEMGFGPTKILKSGKASNRGPKDLRIGNWTVMMLKD